MLKLIKKYPLTFVSYSFVPFIAFGASEGSIYTGSLVFGLMALLVTAVSGMTSLDDRAREARRKARIES